jgi:hypothetical protein
MFWRFGEPAIRRRLDDALQLLLAFRQGLEAGTRKTTEAGHSRW